MLLDLYLERFVRLNPRLHALVSADWGIVVCHPFFWEPLGYGSVDWWCCGRGGASVAAGLTALDIGGSLRVPAPYCGVFAQGVVGVCSGCPGWPLCFG